MSITLINPSNDFPEFKVNLTPTKKSKTTAEKVYAAGVGTIKGLGILFKEFGKATYDSVRLSGKSFKYTVLGYYSDGIGNRFTHSSFNLVIFKVVYWFLSIGVNIISNTISGVSAQYKRNDITKVFASKEMNIGHLKSISKKVDVSHVSAQVQVNDLLTYFAKINFTDKNKPGYFSPNPEYKKGLELFVERVNGRIPFLATPPASNLPKLFEFYQHIENCIRATLHHVNQKIDAFEAENGTDYASFDAATKKKYNDLMEDRGRIIIDIAIAGNYCGSRYMSEATNAYFLTCGEDNGLGGETLETDLIETLSHERRKIAEAEILSESQDVHDYAAYMSALGQDLGIPGTENMSEQLKSSGKKDKKLKSFFEKYTVNRIIDTINAKIKTSQSFREKVQDWMKSNAGDWNRAKHDKAAASIVESLEKIIKEAHQASDVQNEQIAILKQIAEKVSIDNHPDWDEFFVNFMAHEEAKKILAEKFSNQMKKMQFVNNLKIAAKGSLKPIFEGIVKKQPLSDEKTQQIIEKSAKVKKAIALFVDQEYEANADTITRIIEGDLDLKSAVRDLVAQNQGPEFITALNIENIAIEGLRPDLMEWLLVAHGILMPQNVLQAGAETFTSNEKEWLTKRFGVPYTNDQDYVKNLHEKVVKLDGSEKRYKGQPSKDLILRTLFEQAYTNDPKKTEAEFGHANPGYSAAWKAVWITIPRAISNLAKNEVFLIAALIATTVATIAFGFAAYTALEYVVAAKAIPFFINNASLGVVNVLNKTWDAIEFLVTNAALIGLGVYGAAWIVRKLPRIPVLTNMAERVTFMSIVQMIPPSQGIWTFLFSRTIDIMWGAGKVYKSIGKYAGRIASESELLYNAKAKEKMYSVWKNRYAVA